VTDPLIIGIRFVLYTNLMLLFGLPLFWVYAPDGTERLQNTVLPLRALIGGLSVAGILCSLLNIVAITASMAGVPLAEVRYTAIHMVIFETPIGRAWMVRVLALLVTLVVALCMREAEGRRKLALVVSGSAIALASLAWMGHGAASDGAAGATHLVADISHLLGAGAWLGALVVLTMMLFNRSVKMSDAYLRLAHQVLAGFSTVGTIIVAVIIGSGLVNSWMLIVPQTILSFGATLYGQLLLAKLFLFGIMLTLAAANRLRLTPALNHALQSGRTPEALRMLRRSLAFELGIALVILGLVAWLGTLEPPVSMIHKVA
jgi:copper resistance protein D